MSKESALAQLSGSPDVVSRETPAAIESATPGTEIHAPKTESAPIELESSRFAQLAKKEAAIVARQEQVRADKAALEAEKQRVQEQKTKFDTFESLRKTDAIAAMQSLGFNETEIFNYFASLEKKEPTPEEQAKKVAQEVLENYKKEQAELAATAQAQRNKEVIGQFRDQITKFVESEKENYKYCAFNGAVADQIIFNTVDEVLKTSGEMLSIKDAAEIVEKFYREQDEAMAVLRAPKTEVQLPITEEKPVNASVPKPTTKTIPPRATATISSTTPIKRNETRTEKRERLMKKLANGGV